MMYSINLHNTCRLVATLFILICLLFNSTTSLAAGPKAQIRWTGLGVEIAGDVNRDGHINVHPDFTDNSGVLVKSDMTQEPYLIWINDDDDYYSSEVNGSDAPGEGTPDAGGFFLLSGGIDGTRDLIDFFPVAINLHTLLQEFDTNPNSYARVSNTGFASDNYVFQLRQEDEAVNVVFTAMTMSQANAYLIDTRIAGAEKKQLLGDWHGSGDDLNDIRTEEVTADGLIIRPEFIQHVKDTEDSGVILVEGISASNKPLQLVLRNKITGEKTPLGQIALSINSVTDFYRYVNLRGVETGGAVPAVPPAPLAFKDGDSNNKHMIAMHGYNVSEKSARGWAAETFKRIWQTGSNAMFTFVTWTGNKTQIIGSATPNYWTNVVNAFNTSESLAQIVNALPGNEKHITGHSLGNMVISDAIVSHGMQVNNYFMMDAAVALESYDIASIEPASIDRMRNPVWQHYIDDSCTSKTSPCVDDQDKINERWLWSTEWYQLFDTNDARRKITWRNVFNGIFSKTNVKNYFSSTEEVLAESDGTVSSLDAVTGDGGIGYRSWTIQEMGKGTDIYASNLAESHNEGELDKYAGWGINYVDYNEAYVEGFDYSIFIHHIGIFGDPLDENALRLVAELPLTPASAWTLTTEQVREVPFFKGFSNEHGHDVLYGPKTTLLSADVVEPLLPHLRGHAIPALSDATGSHTIPEIKTQSGQILFDIADDNIDMSTKLRNDWPTEREADPASNGIKRWKHGDLKDVAYLYVYKLYENFVRIEAKLDQ